MWRNLGSGVVLKGFSVSPKNARYMSQSSRDDLRQQQDQGFVPVRSDIDDADDHEEADRGRGCSEPHAPPPAAGIRFGHNSRDADQYRRFAERSQVVDRVERGVE